MKLMLYTTLLIYVYRSVNKKNRIEKKKNQEVKYIDKVKLKNEQTHKEEKVKYNKQQQKTLILPPYPHS